LVTRKDVNAKHIYLITHPGIKGMSEILNYFKNYVPVANNEFFNFVT